MQKLILFLFFTFFILSTHSLSFVRYRIGTTQKEDLDISLNDIHAKS
jgi:hypothetical protein